MEKRKVLITGATGMVGYHVAKHLGALGHCVVASVREGSDTSALTKLSADAEILVSRLDLSDMVSTIKIMTGCDAVVHCAGNVDPLGKRQDIMSVNVGLTKSCLAAATSAGVRQFIHVSSLSVITAQEDQFGVNESAPLTYCGEAYADSKVDAEKVVTAGGGTASIQYTIVRPGFIYGPGEKAWMPRLIDSLSKGKVLLIDGGGKQTNVIYVDNLCRAIELCLLNPAAYGQIFNLTDGKTPSKKQLFDSICDGLGYTRPKKSIPAPLAKQVCNAVSSIAPFLPVSLASKLGGFSRAAFRLAGVNQGFDISKAEREIGYTNRIPFNEGMSRTLAHFKASKPKEELPTTVTGNRKT